MHSGQKSVVELLRVTVPVTWDTLVRLSHRMMRGARSDKIQSGLVYLAFPSFALREVIPADASACVSHRQKIEGRLVTLRGYADEFVREFRWGHRNGADSDPLIVAARSSDAWELSYTGPSFGDSRGPLYRSRFVEAVAERLVVASLPLNCFQGELPLEELRAMEHHAAVLGNVAWIGTIKAIRDLLHARHGTAPRPTGHQQYAL